MDNPSIEEARVLISQLKAKLENQKKEYEKTMEEAYEEAYQLILTEKTKNNALMVALDEEKAKLAGEKEKLAQLQELMDRNIYSPFEVSQE